MPRALPLDCHRTVQPLSIATLGLARNLPAARSKGAVMYFWKCWRETRVSFYVFLFIAVTLSALLWKIMDFTMSELPPKQLFALAWVILLFAYRAFAAGIRAGAHCDLFDIRHDLPIGRIA